MGPWSLGKEAETGSSLGTRTLEQKAEGMEMGSGPLEINFLKKLRAKSVEQRVKHTRKA